MGFFGIILKVEIGFLEITKLSELLKKLSLYNMLSACIIYNFDENHILVHSITQKTQIKVRTWIDTQAQLDMVISLNC